MSFFFLLRDNWTWEHSRGIFYVLHSGSLTSRLTSVHIGAAAAAPGKSGFDMDNLTHLVIVLSLPFSVRLLIKIQR